MANDFFSLLTGGGMGGAYDSLLSEEQKRKINQQSLMSLGARLLQASGPSTTRTNMGQALGGAFIAGQEARQAAETNAINQMLTKQKIDEYQRDIKTKEAISKFLGVGDQQAAAAPAAAQMGPSGAPFPVTAPQVPGGGAPAAPAIGAVPPAASGANPNIALANKYRQLATLLGPMDITKANAYLTMADKLAPQDVPTGAPFEAKGPDGKNILVQRTTGGSLIPVSGYSPAGPSQYQLMQYGLDLQRFGLSQKEFERGNYTLEQTADGYAYVPKVPGMPVIPLTAGGAAPAAVPGAAPGAMPGAAPGAQLKPASAKPTADQSNAVGFAQRMERTDAILGQMSGKHPGVGTAMAQSIPFIGGFAGRQVMSPEQQQYKQAADDWIRAKLRKESGANIPPDEMQQEYETYFPLPGEDDKTIQQKAYARQVATNAMRYAAGEHYKPWQPSEEERKSIYGEKPTAQKQMVWNPVTKKYEFK